METKAIAPDDRSRRKSPIPMILLVLALLTSPALCCGGVQLLDAMPSAWIPPALNFIVNLFEGEARIENRTSQTLYVTAITTTYGKPMVIPQNVAFRQRDIPIKPQESIALQYDMADLPLAGIVVCQQESQCRVMKVHNSNLYEVNSYDDLEELEPGWMEAAQASPKYSYDTLIIASFSLVPIMLWSSWLFLKWRKRQEAAQ